MAKNSNEILKTVLESSEGRIFKDDDFLLPTDADFFTDNFNIDVYNIVNKTDIEQPLYLETPFSVSPGYYRDKRAFIVKATPYIKECIQKIGGDDQDYEQAEMNKNLFYDDGDTVYFMNKSLVSGTSAFNIGDVTFSSLEDFVNVKSNMEGKFGVRFLGIDTPEIPHYSIIPYEERDLKKERYGDIKNSSNIVSINYKHVYGTFVDEVRSDDDIVTLFYDKDANMYFEVVNDNYYVFGEGSGYSTAQIVTRNDSNPRTVKDGLRMTETVRNMISSADDMVIMLDQKSLSRQSNYYESPYNLDYFSHDFAHGLAPWKTIRSYWEKFHSEARYRQLGFNAWGQDNNKRFLGTIYLKTRLAGVSGEEPVWINLSKYVLQEYADTAEQLPDYTSDPKSSVNSGFVSDAFKLWTYNLKNQKILDSFTAYTEDHIQERNKMFEGMLGTDINSIKNSTVILGDSVLLIPPSSIRSISHTEVERSHLLRSRGAAMKQSPTSKKTIELSLYFNNEEGINGTPYEVTLPNGANKTYYMNGLRSLIAQFKLIPFAPIENEYINEVLNVDAVTLAGLTVSTVENFPRLLEATLTLQEFNYHVYMPELQLGDIESERDLSANMMARSIHYPVMRWYYQRLLERGDDIKNLEFASREHIEATFGSTTALVPMSFEDHSISFYLPDRDHLDGRMQVYMERENGPIKTHYDLTDSMKKTIATMAPLASKMSTLFNNEAFRSDLNNLCNPCKVKYTGSSYRGHSIYDRRYNTIVNSKEANCELVYETRNNVIYGSVSDLYKAAQIDEFSFKKASDFISDRHEKKVTGTPAISNLVFDKLNSTIGLPNNILIKGTKELSSVTNNGVVTLIAQVSLPVDSMTEFETEEFKKYVITKLGIDSSKNIFSKGPNGRIAIDIEFSTPARYVTSSAKNYYVIEEGSAFTLNTETDGYKFLKLCEDNTRKITSEDGDDVFTDYVDDAMDNNLEDLNTQNYIESADSIPFVKMDFGEEITLSSLTCSYVNNFAKIKLNAIDGGAHQFCGGQDILIEASIITKNKSVASLLQELPRLAASYAIDYKEILPFWPLRIKSEISQLFGVNEVLIETVDLTTVENYPGVYTAVIRMVSVDRATRNRETLKKIEGIDNFGSTANGVGAKRNIKTYFDIDNVLSKAEIYPDLELPTLDELEYIGYKMIRYYDSNGITRSYVDPDFYYIYSAVLTSDLFSSAIQSGFSKAEQEFGIDISDRIGGNVTIISTGDEEIPIEIINENSTASTLTKSLLSARSKASASDIGKAMSLAAWESLDDKLKMTTRLTDGIVTLKTPLWQISNKYVFPLREEHLKDGDDENELYTELINSRKEEMLSFINDELASPLFMSKIGISTYPSYKIANENDAITSKTEKEIIKKTEKRIKEFTKRFNSKKEFFSGLAHDKEIEKGNSGESFIYDKIISAYADAKTGASFCEAKNATGFIPFLSSDEDKNKKDGWKANPFLVAGGKLIPYSKVRKNGQTFALDVEDAVKNGYTFGVHQIQMYEKDALIPFLSEDEVKRVSESPQSLFFLDPYYRNLQLEDPESEEIENYKKRIIYDPAMSAYAFTRNLMVWYKKLLEEDLVVSMYESAKAAAAKEINKQITKMSTPLEYSLNMHDEEVIEKNLEKNIKASEKAIKDVYEIHEKMFALLYSVGVEAPSMTDKYDESHLMDIGVPVELWDTIKKYRSKKEKDLEKYVKELVRIINAEVEDERLNGERNKHNVEVALRIAGYNFETGELGNVLENEIIKYGSDIVLEYKLELNRNALNNQTYEQMLKQMIAIRDDIINGKLIGLSMLLMNNGNDIYNLIVDKNVDALNTLMSSLVSSEVNSENLELKKFLMALDGKKVLDLEYINDIPRTAEEAIRLASTERVIIDRCNNPQEYLKDSYLDMIKNDKRGRMVRAFPTYYMIFVDEGRDIGLWHLHDNFYNMNAISEISVTKSRKIAADTAMITMSNMFKTFSTEDPQKNLDASEINSVRYNMRDAFNSIFSPRAYAMKEEEKRRAESDHRAAQLEPGVRVHLRMGYGSNAGTLPVVFNGNIAEVGTSDLVDIVAQSDAIELMNPINTTDDAEDTKNEEKFFISKYFSNKTTNGITPRELLSAILTADGSWLQKEIKEASSGRFFRNNPYGIFHFGDRDYKEVFAGSEVVQNIYEANARATYGKSGEYTGLEENYDTKDTPSISMHLHGKTFWDIMHVCASVQPDFITSVAPFGMRSTVFYGAPRYYYAYAYDQVQMGNSKSAIVEKRKPFQQYHIYTSFSDIIHNNITASAKGVKTNAVGLYQQKKMWGEKVKQVGPLFLDYDIYPEYQKSMTVDTQLWAKGMPVLGNAFGITAATSRDVSDTGWNKIPGAKEIAWRMTASALKDSVKEMYVGEITVIGDPSTKPYDRMFISDTYARIDGQCEIEAVVHSFTPYEGFTTSLYADCISVVDDAHEKIANLRNSQIAGLCIATGIANASAAFLGKSGKPIVSALIRHAGKPISKGFNMANKMLNISDKKMIEKIALRGDSALIYSGLGGTSNMYNLLLNSIDGAAGRLSAFKGVEIVDSIQMEKLMLGISDALKSIDASKFISNLRKVGNQDVGAAIIELTNVSASTGRAMRSTLDLSASDLKVIRGMAQSKHLDEVTRVKLLKAQKGFFRQTDDIELFVESLRKISSVDPEAANNITKRLSYLSNSADEITKIAADTTKAISESSTIKAAFKLKDVSKAAGILINVGWFAVELMISIAISAHVSEFIYRHLQNLEVLTIFPLKKNGKVMTAGINGHKGVVVGSPTENDQGEWTKFATSLFDGEKGGAAKNTLNVLLSFFLDANKIKEAANRIKDTNGVPVIESDKTQTQVHDIISKEIGDIVFNKTKQDIREVMFLERIPGVDKKYSSYLEKLQIKGDYDNSPKGIDLTEKTVPIMNDPEISKMLESRYASLFVSEGVHDTKTITVNFNGENVSLNCLTTNDGGWIVPTLREEAILLLKDTLKMTSTIIDVKEGLDLEKNPYHVFITSATVVSPNSTASWENTGLCFRLALDSRRYTPSDLIKVCENTKNYYSSLGAPGFMTYKQNKSNTMEALFMVMPVKEIGD